jgi:hypothetical protein
MIGPKHVVRHALALRIRSRRCPRIWGPERSSGVLESWNIVVRLRLRIGFPILRKLSLNLRRRLPSLAFLEASARAGYGTQESLPLLLGKRQHVCLLLRGVDPAGFHYRVDRVWDRQPAGSSALRAV